MCVWNYFHWKGWRIWEEYFLQLLACLWLFVFWKDSVKKSNWGRGNRTTLYASVTEISKLRTKWIQAMMVMLCFFHAAGIKSGAVKQDPTDPYHAQKLGFSKLWFELEHKILPRPSQLETLGMKETDPNAMWKVISFSVCKTLLSRLPLEQVILQSLSVKKLASFLFQNSRNW